VASGSKWEQGSYAEIPTGPLYSFIQMINAVQKIEIFWTKGIDLIGINPISY